VDRGDRIKNGLGNARRTGELNLFLRRGKPREGGEIQKAREGSVEVSKGDHLFEFGRDRTNRRRHIHASFKIWRPEGRRGGKTKSEGGGLDGEKNNIKNRTEHIH